MESFGISLFIFNIPGLSDIWITVLLMNCVFLIPIIVSVYRTCLRDHGQSRWKLLFVLAVFFEIGGIALTAYLMKDISLDKIWMAPVAVLCLSISWTPRLLDFLLQTEAADNVNHVVEENGEETYVEQSVTTGSSGASRSESTGYQSLTGVCTVILRSPY